MTFSFQKAVARSCIACALFVSLCLILFSAPLVLAQDASSDAPEEAGAAEQAAPDDISPDASSSEETTSEETATSETDAGGDDAEAAKPWDTDKPCANVQHPYQADICQQWRAAEASESTAAFSRFLMLIALFVLLLLIFMLIAVMRAASAARQAAESGGSAPAPISGAARPMDREGELRAYVDVDSLEFIETPEADGVVKVKIALRNSGQTPALKLDTVAEMEIVDISEEVLLPVRSVPERASADSSRPRLGRDASATVIVQCESSPKLAEQVTGGEATILVWGACGYYDVFDRRRRTVFQYFCNAETLESGEMFRPMVRGDEES